MLVVQGLGPRRAEAPVRQRRPNVPSYLLQADRVRAWRRLPTLGRVTRLTRSPIQTLIRTHPPRHTQSAVPGYLGTLCCRRFTHLSPQSPQPLCRVAATIPPGLQMGVWARRVSRAAEKRQLWDSREPTPTSCWGVKLLEIASIGPAPRRGRQPAHLGHFITSCPLFPPAPACTSDARRDLPQQGAPHAPEAPFHKPEGGAGRHGDHCRPGGSGRPRLPAAQNSV